MFLSKWHESKVDHFWGAIAPGEHVVHFYERDSDLINLLTEFVADGLRRNETIVLIATYDHLVALDERIKNVGLDPFELKLLDKLITLDAHHALGSFMIGDRPDEILFRHVMGLLLARAEKRKAPIRAFGEMVALLWIKGLTKQTIQLEQLWNDLKESESFSLFCAYPRRAMGHETSESVLNICGTHSKIISTANDSVTDLVYKDLSFNKP